MGGGIQLISSPYDAYQINSTTQTCNQSFGWFYIHILTNFTDIAPKFGYSTDTIFKVSNMVYPDIYYSYLSETEYNRIKNIDGVKTWCKTKNITKRILSLEGENYLVTACANWNPSLKYQSLTDNLFVVNNLTDTRVLDRDPCISSYKIAPKFQLNNRYSVGYILSDENYLRYNDMGEYIVNRELHDKGLNGLGQIITIGDTGVDYNHEFFRDPTQNIMQSVNKTNLNHRKIIRIEAYSDYYDYANGHGTHVAGSALGEAYTNDSYISQYNGIAPKAKLYMIDMGYANITSDLSATPNYRNVVDNMRAMDSGIYSNSWNFNEYSYEYTSMFDELAYNNSDILFVFSAGNVYGPMTVVSPGDSKNALTVGMTAKPSSFHFEYPLYRAYKFTGDTSDKIPLIGTPNYSAPYFPVTPKLKTYKDVPLTFDAPKEGSAYFTTGDPCTEIKKAIEAKASIFIYTADSCVLDNPIDLVCARIDQKLAPIIQSWTKVSIEADLLVGYDIYAHPYSSQGPCFNGVTKPDLSGPGYNLISAKARATGDSMDALSEKTGTSMACPLISGSAALVRQWFMNGNYRGITKPSSSLIRAVLINSAIQIYQGFFRTPASGYGVPYISRGLGMKELKHFFLDRVPLKSGQFHTYRIMTTRKTNLSITMSYVDRATHSNYVLFADFGIILEKPDGEFVVSNNHTDIADESLSTNERILVMDADIGIYKLYVYANKYGDNYIENYSLAILGGLSSSSVKLIDNEQSLSTCSSNIYDENGRCQCVEGTRGFICREKVETLPYNVSATKIIQPLQYSWFSFTTAAKTDYSVYISDLSHNYFHACLCPTTDLNTGCYCRMSIFEARLGKFFTENETHSYIAVAPISQNPSLTRFYIGKDMDNTPASHVTLLPGPTTVQPVSLITSKSTNSGTTTIILISSAFCALLVIVCIVIVIAVSRKRRQRVEDKDHTDEDEQYEYEEEDYEHSDQHEEDYSSSQSVSIDVSKST